MNKIYTSYFANWRNFPGEAVAVGITRFKPNYWQQANLENLAPSEGLLHDYRNKNVDEYVFKMRYLGELRERGLTPEIVREGLYNYSRGFDIVLCCYEKPKDFCHRHILAEWLGEDVKEL